MGGTIKERANPDGEPVVGKLRLLAFTNAISMALGVLLFYSCLLSVDVQHRYLLCMLGMIVGLLVVIDGLATWISIWQHQNKNMAPLFFSLGLLLFSVVSLLSFGTLQYVFWDKQTQTSEPSEIKIVDKFVINRLYLIVVCLMIFFVLFVTACTTLALRWKNVRIYQYCVGFLSFFLMIIGFLMAGFCALVMDNPLLTRWPTCWSLYAAMGAGLFIACSNIYALPIRERPQLINYMVFLFLGAIASCSSYVNYFTANTSKGRVDMLYYSAIVGIVGQLLTIFTFAMSFVWRSRRTTKL